MRRSSGFTKNASCLVNEPYIVQISSGDAIMFGCEYESEFERTSYLLGTDVF